MQLTYAPIRRMEPPIIERLRIAFDEKTFGIERVPQVLTLKEFGRLATMSPFIGLAWVGMKPDPNAGRILKGNMLWRLILVFKASSSLETRFKGDALDIGLDAMVDVAAVLLQGFTFDGIGLCIVTSINSVIADGWSDDDLVIAQIDFEVAFSIAPAAFNLRTAEDFQRLGITWKTSTDADRDVTDTIDLPQE